MKNILLLQNRYIPILFIFAALVIFRFFYMSDIVHKNQYDGRIMNLSGKQRMYSQRSLVAAQAYFIDKTEQNKNIYISTLEQTDKNRELFNQALTQSGHITDEAHKDISAFADKYKNLHLEFLKEPTPERLKELGKTSTLLVAMFDNSVSEYEADSKLRYKKLDNVLYTTTAVFLGVLIFAAFFVFRPASRKITDSTDELARQKRELQNYVDAVDKHVITSSTDLKGNITYASDAFCHISQYTKEELLGKNHRIVRHPDMSSKLYDDLWGTIVSGGTWSGEIKNLCKDGSSYWVWADISPFYDNGKKIGYTAVRQDITDKKRIEEISIRDGMTGLFNRRYFNDIFPKTINGAKRDGKNVAFLILDVDHFKQYNDTYGHQKGDDVLIKISATIQDTFKRNGDLCFRLGGEEFGVVFVGNDEQTAFDMANKLRKNIESLAMEHSKNSASKYVTASMGLTIKNSRDVVDMDILYKEADDLLYKAKESGRNKVFMG